MTGSAAEAASLRPAAAVIVTRSQWLFGLFLVASLNGFIGITLKAVERLGWAHTAINLFEISAILWLALVAGLRILVRDGETRPPTRGDVAIGLIVLAAALLPAPSASAFGLSLLAGWAILTSAPGSAGRRAGIIFLAMTGALLWGRLALALFSRPLLDIDAWFVSALLDAGHRGNLIWSSDGASRLVVAPGCSSMQGMSLAIVFWATVNQSYRVPFGWKAAAYCLAALAATVAVNVLRIGSMLRWPEHLHEIHHGWGYHLSMWVTLALIAGIVLYGARREVFDAR